MRLLADENCPRSLVRALREDGHDVASVSEVSPGVSDREVITIARRERRVVATFDKGFGDLAFRSGLSAPRGVVLFRVAGDTPDALVERARSALATRKSWAGLFATVTSTEIRVRRLPARRKSAR